MRKFIYLITLSLIAVVSNGQYNRQRDTCCYKDSIAGDSLYRSFTVQVKYIRKDGKKMDVAYRGMRFNWRFVYYQKWFIRKELISCVFPGGAVSHF
jgi:hypothetical protein